MSDKEFVDHVTKFRTGISEGHPHPVKSDVMKIYIEPDLERAKLDLLDKVLDIFDKPSSNARKREEIENLKVQS